MKTLYGKKKMTISNNKDNPATRLYKILSLAKKEDIKQPTSDVWRSVLGRLTGYSTEVEYLQGLVYLHELTAEVKNSMKHIPLLKKSSGEIYNKLFRRIEEVILSCESHEPWNKYESILSSEVMMNLKFIAEKLSMSNYKIADNVHLESLSDISKEVDDLVVKIIASTLDENLKNIILDQLHAIRKSISLYKIKGVEGLNDALVHIYGQLVANHNLFQKEKNKDVVRDFGKAFFKFANIVNAVYRFGEIGYDAGKFIAGLIGNDIPPD